MPGSPSYTGTDTLKYVGWTKREIEMTGAELLLDGVRIIIQILVDVHEQELTPEVKIEIQNWYDELEQKIADARR